MNDRAAKRVIDARVINIDEVELQHFENGTKFACDAVRVGPLVGAKDLGYSYDVVPPGKRVTKEAGEWNKMRIVAKGRKVAVEINGEKVVDADLDEHKDAFKKHPGLERKEGHIGLQSHDGRVEFRNIYVKPL